MRRAGAPPCRSSRAPPCAAARVLRRAFAWVCMRSMRVNLAPAVRSPSALRARARGTEDLTTPKVALARLVSRRPPLHRAARAGDARAVARVLREGGAEVDGRDAVGSTALCHACERRRGGKARAAADADTGPAGWLAFRVVAASMSISLHGICAI